MGHANVVVTSHSGQMIPGQNGKVQPAYIKRGVPLSEKVQPRSIRGKRKTARGHGLGFDSRPRKRLGTLSDEIDASEPIQRLAERIVVGRRGRYGLSFEITCPDRPDDFLRLVAFVDRDVAICGNATDTQPRMPQFDAHRIHGRSDRLAGVSPPVQGYSVK